jgi:hypothetical protein
MVTAPLAELRVVRSNPASFKNVILTTPGQGVLIKVTYLKMKRK